MNTPSCKFVLYLNMDEVIVWKTLWSIKVWKFMLIFKTRVKYDKKTKVWKSA